jgi:hypothetical protein
MKNMKTEKFVTIYTTNEMFGNIVKREGRLIECGLRDYAQYRNVPYVKYIPKGKRLATGFVKTSPYLVIIKGLGHPEPGDMFEQISSENGTTVSKSKYMSFDSRYKTDFDEVLQKYLTPEMTILDCRHTVGFPSKLPRLD